MFKILSCYLTFVATFATDLHEVHGNPQAKISPDLNNLLREGHRVNVVVYFVDGVKPALDKAAALRISDRPQNNQAIIEALKDHADNSQGGVVQLLSTRSSSGAEGGFKYFKQYWNSNKIFIKEANEATVKAVAEDPQVLKIKKEIMGRIPDVSLSLKHVETEEDGIAATKRKMKWNMKIIQVEEAWEELDGNRGNGVTIGIIDSGVRPTHEALKDNFIGVEYGWYDAMEHKTDPSDQSGHGTHTTGTAVGTTGIGVAPGARWMSCKTCNETYCPGEALLDCIKFMACPTLPDGSNPDCSKAPRIVSNSWVVERGADDFNEDILRWRAMGIIPVFAVGNDGNWACNLTKAPAENSFVIGVGATEIKDVLNDQTCAGWGSDGSVKPDISAPGEDVYSSWINSDTDYKLMGGTSAATPHVAGVVALLMGRNPNLTYEEAYSFLTQNTDTNIHMHYLGRDYYCNSTENPIDPSVLPNVFYGYGRLNAFKAVQAQSRVLKNKQEVV